MKLSVKLNNGVEMPLLGLGTWKLKEGEECENAVKWALEAGYRHVDTAMIYHNEKSVGKAIKESGLDRKEIFVTTKLWNSDHLIAEEALQASLDKLGLDYVDLYLMHWPTTGTRIQGWKNLEKLYERGLCRAVGISNFTLRHLKELLAETSVIPAVNQVEFSPFLYQKELWEYCKSKGIQLEAYSPLTRGSKLDNPVLQKIALAHNKNPAQVIIRWLLQKNIVVIPKSSHKERIRENIDLDFVLSNEELSELDSLNEDYRMARNPEDIP